MSLEFKNQKTPIRLAVLVALASLASFASIIWWSSRPDPAPIAPSYTRTDDSAKTPDRRTQEYVRLQFGATQAVAIAIEEVKKREGWSGKPEWVKNIEFDEGPSWVITVKRKPNSSEGQRRVSVDAMTGKVDYYVDPSKL